MSDEKAVVKYEYETDHGLVTLTPEIVTKYLVSGEGKITSGELAMFLNICKYQKLNPFLREVYLIKYSDRDPASIVVGKDVHQKRAAKHPQFDGIESGVIVLDAESKLVERPGSFTMPEEKIVGGWATGHRKDWSTPRKITVSYEEYVVRKKSDNLPNRTWAKMPGTMIVKVAEAQCLRAMFPEELQALYNAEEMGAEPGALPQTPLPQGNDKTVEELREDIEQLIEDNKSLLGWDYGGGISEKTWETEDVTILANILNDLKAEIKSLRMKEARVATKDYNEQLRLAKKYGEEPPLPDSEPDSEELF
jgi:phage recombination protein Bet